MLFTTFGAIALAASFVNGFENSSPFFFYSTSEIELPSVPGIAKANQIHHLLSQALASCPTKNYAVVVQPGVVPDDYQGAKNNPFLAGKLGQQVEGTTSIMVRDVVEQVYTTGMINTILMDCLPFDIRTVRQLDTSELLLPELDAKTIRENVIYAPLPPVTSSLSKEERKIVLRNHDMYLEGLVKDYFGGEDYTLIYITESSHEAETKEATVEDKEYQMESEVPLVADTMHHNELVRRNLGTLKDKSGTSNNQTLIDGPLFAKYQFFTPGIFMGFFVGFILLMILYVGVSALSSLQVTYGAFDKEQGQLAGKKQ